MSGDGGGDGDDYGKNDDVSDSEGGRNSSNSDGYDNRAMVVVMVV